MLVTDMSPLQHKVTTCINMSDFEPQHISCHGYLHGIKSFATEIL